MERLTRICHVRQSTHGRTLVVESESLAQRLGSLVGRSQRSRGHSALRSTEYVSQRGWTNDVLVGWSVASRHLFGLEGSVRLLDFSLEVGAEFAALLAVEALADDRAQ